MCLKGTSDMICGSDGTSPSVLSKPSFLETAGPGLRVSSAEETSFRPFESAVWPQSIISDVPQGHIGYDMRE